MVVVAPFAARSLLLAWLTAGAIAPSSADDTSRSDAGLVADRQLTPSLGADMVVRLWAKNLTNERYWSFADEISFETFYSPAPPRTFGLTIMKRFE